MKKTKTQKGITLVALIITIVVLLILASVAINSIVNTDIIGHAKNAADKYNSAQEQENIFLNEYVNFLKNEMGTGGSDEECAHVSGEPTYTASESEPEKHIVTINCTKCNELVSQTAEEHSGEFSYNAMSDWTHDFNGLCDVCSENISGNEKCEWVRVSVSWFDEYGAQWECECSKCGYQDLVTYEHDLNDSGVCSNGCGYGEEAVNSCSHSWNGEMTYVTQGEWTCTWEGLCYDCNTNVSEVEFEHNLIDGYCEYCNYCP